MVRRHSEPVRKNCSFQRMNTWECPASAAADGREEAGKAGVSRSQGARPAERGKATVVAPGHGGQAARQMHTLQRRPAACIQNQFAALPGCLGLCPARACPAWRRPRQG